MQATMAKAVRRMTNLLLGLEQATLFAQLRSGWPADPRRILVHRAGNIGDTVVAVPALLAIRQSYPSAEITLLTSPGADDSPSAVDVLEGTGIIDRYVTYYPLRLRSRRQRLSFATQLKAHSFDLFVSLSPAGGGKRIRTLFRDMVFAKVAGCRKVGGFRLASLPQHWVPSYHGDGRLVLAESERLLALVPGGTALWRHLDVQWPGLSEVKKDVAHLLGAYGLDGEAGAVVVHPGAKLPLKQWMPERFAALAKHIAGTYGVKIVLTGGRSDAETCSRIAASVPLQRSVNLAGKTTLREFLGVLAHARAVVSNDTGAIHLAAAAGTPSVAIVSGRDNPVKWMPISSKHLRVRAETDCSPCFRAECPHRTCLTQITVPDATEAFDQCWQRFVLPETRERNA